jgi:hypothetical protein
LNRGKKKTSCDPDLEQFGAERFEKFRFWRDPRRPYLARAVSHSLGKTVFLKRYDLSVWSGTNKWLEKVIHRCELIEQISEGRTRFILFGAMLHRISVPVLGLRRCRASCPMTAVAYTKLVKTIVDAHSHGVIHGDVSARNIRARAENMDLFDWEPILLAPGAGPAKEPVPDYIPDPRRWLGACELLAQVGKKANVCEIDYQGLANIRKHFCETAIDQKPPFSIMSDRR